MTERGSCPSGYNWYVCALSAYQGCCRIDPCSLPSGCPSDSQLSSALPSGSGLRTTSTIAPSSNPGTVSPSATAGTPSVPPISPTTPPILPTLPTKPKESSLNPTPGFSTSGTAASGSSPSASSGSSKNSNGTNPVPQAIIVGVTIGGALVIVIIILIIILWRRRRESRDGLPGYSSELSPGGGAARAERNGLLAFFTRTRPIPAAKTTTMPTDSPSTTFTELPSSSSQHNSLIPGFVELASPPISPVSGLSSADRVVYSSTNVSTASTGAVVSPMPHESLRGGGRPVMSPNMAHHRREGRKHALSWQSLDPVDGN